MRQLIICLAVLSATPCGAAEPARLDRFDLLKFRAEDGRTQTVADAKTWQARRREILQGMQRIMGDVPGENRRAALNVTIEAEDDAGDYIRRLITYQSEAGSRTPAYLCIPKDVVAGKRTAAAVLCLHPTDNQHGHGVVVGLGGRPNRQYAAELAERGYVTLSPAYPHLANYQPDLKKLGYASGTMKAVWDNMRGLDVLAAMKEVDASRGFGVIGHSLGGHNAIFTAALDPRIQVIVSSCGFDSFSDYYDGAEVNWQHGRGWCQDRYMPRLADYRGRLAEIPFDFSELLGAIAPRTVFVNAPLDDSNFRWRSVDRCVSAALPVYQLLDGEGRLIVQHPDCEHDFPDAQREEAYRIIDKVLRGKAKPSIKTDP